jgi:CheY-like chemotaxis protein
VVERQVQHLTRLLDDLLDVSRVSRGKVRLQKKCLDLGRVVQTTAQDHRASMEDAGLTLEVLVPVEPVWVEGDPTRLAQVVGNLLTNAEKFSNAGGRVSVRLAMDPETGRAGVSVRDTGVGIDADALPRVFDTFAQADRSLDRSRGGLGLGLGLVKGLVELHGGTVGAASPGPGQGSEFSFWLPLAPRGSSAPPSESYSADAPPLRILVIEGNRDAADSLRVLLEVFRHEVRVVYEGAAGLEVARAWRPDVVLCDVGLPGVEGYEVARALRRDPTTAPVRLIATSGFGSDADQQQCRDAGFDLHLVQPVHLDDLKRALAGVHTGGRPG